MLIEFVEKNISTTDLLSPKCTVSSGAVYELARATWLDYCRKQRYIVALIVLTTATFLLGFMGILFFKHQNLVKVWLYANNACMWWVDEEYVDKDKVFDAFISYSQLDENFVHSLVRELENGSPAFKLCVHERDFIPGRLIASSVIHIRR